MTKTKTTPNYEFRRCPMCSYSAKSEEDYREHVFKCAMRTFQCPSCDFSNNKEANLKRHVKRCHPGLAQEDLIKLGVKENRSEEVNEPEDDHEWLSQDPGDLIGDVSDNGSDDDKDSSSQNTDCSPKDDDCLMEGRLFRKPTKPSLPVSLKRKADVVPPVPEKKTKDQAVPVNAIERKRDMGTQTDPVRRIVKTKTVKKFRKGSVDTKIISEEKVVYN
ncbi:RE1-silencing transcription factor-like [Ostrea edulis]|uniref:RE1-silencing transcription factor-like n=1 Tax=Ostrea edulis TaxID=37623 RepID=UPI0024AFA2B5|nr:RE1-silencing transcription factor-like [Ostrea edulis]